LFARSYAARLAEQLRRSCLYSRPDGRAWLDSLMRYAWDTSRSTVERRLHVIEQLIQRFDAIENINALEKWITVPLRDSMIYFPMLKMSLANLPSPDPEIENQNLSGASLSGNANSLITSRKEDLTEYFLVNLMWIGTSDEKKRAMEELKAKTGLKWETQQEWTAWWRTKYQRQ
jgi:hypothetical protein